MKILEKVVQIPHLRLKVPIDLPGLLADLETVKAHAPFVHYETGFGTELNIRWHREAWRGLSIVGYNDDATKGMVIDDDSTGELRVTDLGHQCPNIIDTVRNVIGDPRLSRVRVMEILPGKSLPWHCHFKDLNQWLVKLTVQIPLVVPSGFEYAVTTEDNVARRAPPELHDESLAFRENYRPGYAYVFNSKHYHTVFNNSEESRYTIMLYGNFFKNEWFRRVVEDAAEEYDGPLI